MFDALDIRETLFDLADRANAAHAAAQKSATDAVTYAVEAGTALLRARTLVVHGEWLPWLKENFGGSRQSADRYMLVAANRKQLEANCSRVGNLSLRSAVKLLTKARHANGEAAAPGLLDSPDPTLEPEPLAAALAPARSTDNLESLIAAGEKFGTVYADPPWQYGNQVTRSSTDNVYPTMPLAEIASLPVEQLAADDAHLHLWTTNAFLFEAKEILDAWGFEYRSVFVWVKPQMGIGNYWRVSHEFLLLGIRGDATRFNDRSLKSWGLFDRTEHSRKPERVAEMIEKASPGPYLEMFGRRTRPGWTVWGNQVERSMFEPTEGAA